MKGAFATIANKFVGYLHKNSWLMMNSLQKCWLNRNLDHRTADFSGVIIESVDHPKKREDAYRLLDLFTETTGYQAKMREPSIIGSGR